MSRRLRINIKRLVSGLAGGTFRSSERSSGGYELQEIKEFQPEEDFSAIHLLTSAKRDKLFMVLREPEKAARILFLMDQSRSGKFGSSGVSKLDLQASLLSILGDAVSEGTNQIGLIVFTDRIEKSWKFYIGLGKFIGRLKRALSFTDLGKGTDLKTAVEFAEKLKPRPDLIILASDFLADENYGEAIGRLNRKSDLICLIVCDPKEAELKAPRFGCIAVRDLENRRFGYADGTVQTQPGEQLIKALNVDCETFYTNDSQADQWGKLSRLFERRRIAGVTLK